jgi:hypothetical protein
MPIKWGSLYTVVRNLDRHGLVEAAQSSRHGARPERTVYRITDDGRAELVDWVRELVSTPEPEQPRFTAGLSVLTALPPTRRPTCCAGGSTGWSATWSSSARSWPGTPGGSPGCSW